MEELLLGREDATLTARVVSRAPLLYRAGPDARADRPGHVRAASGLAWAGTRLAVIQDDALHLGLVSPATGEVDVVELPAGHDGVRLFDEARGNKRLKLDLEACLSVGDRLVAFGSGSTSERERILLVGDAAGPVPRATIAHVPRWYEALRGCLGTPLNLEGAILLGGTVRLFQRGNVAPDGPPRNASCDVSWSDLLAHVGGKAAPPAVGRLQRYDLGRIDGVRLGFTDAALRGEDVWFLAAAEASPDAVRDGPVVGSVLGRLGDGLARWTRLVDERGKPIREKAEGLAFDTQEPARAYVVIDRDDPACPSEMCILAVEGA